MDFQHLAKAVIRQALIDFKRNPRIDTELYLFLTGNSPDYSFWFTLADMQPIPSRYLLSYLRHYCLAS